MQVEVVRNMNFFFKIPSNCIFVYIKYVTYNFAGTVKQKGQNGIRKLS